MISVLVLSGGPDAEGSVAVIVYVYVAVAGDPVPVVVFGCLVPRYGPVVCACPGINVAGYGVLVYAAVVE